MRVAKRHGRLKSLWLFHHIALLIQDNCSYMKIIQIRDVPDTLYRQLKEIAEIERRSLSQQAIVMLAKGLQVEPTPKQRRIEVIDGIKRKAKKPSIPLSDPTILIRRDRSR